MHLLVILPRVPYPLEKGDKLRAYHQIRCLSERHTITLVALSDGKVHPQAEAHLQQYCRELYIVPLPVVLRLWNMLRAFLAGWPLQVGYFYSISAHRLIHRLADTGKYDRVYCQLLRTGLYAKDLSVKSVMDYQDTFSAGMRRRKEKAPWYFRPFFDFEYRRLRRFEEVSFNWFGGHTLISEPDRELFPHTEKERIAIVGNGVEFGYFSPMDRPLQAEVLFTGNMGYPPNIDAAVFLAGEIMPLVREGIPDARLVLAGASPHLRVRSLSGPLTRVTGWVDDMREWYAASSVFVAPMRMGTGLQNKLLEAMAMQLPCITTPLANDALGAAPGIEILTGRDAKEIAEGIIRLLQDESLSASIGKGGNDFVRKHYNWEMATRKLERLLQD